MKIPRFIERIFEPKPPPVDETVTYEDERLQSSYLGSIPYDYWSYSPFGGGYTSCGQGGCNYGGRSIYRNTPVYEPDNEPRVDNVTEHIFAHTYSVPLFGALGLAGGGAVGYGVGALVGHLADISSPWLKGGLAGLGALGGGIGLAGYAAGDRVRLEWREEPIYEKRLAGYWHHVSPHWETRCRTVRDPDGDTRQECETYQNGWDHTFTPDVEYWAVGSHLEPRVVHYQDEGGQWKPVPIEEPKPGDRPRGESPKQPNAPQEMHLDPHQ